MTSSSNRVEQITFASRELASDGLPADYYSYVLIAFDQGDGAICEVLVLSGAVRESVPKFRSPVAGATGQLGAMEQARAWLAEQHDGLISRSHPHTVSERSKEEMKNWIELSKKILSEWRPG